jgi:hypothetical protein
MAPHRAQLALLPLHPAKPAAELPLPSNRCCKPPGKLAPSNRRCLAERVHRRAAPSVASADAESVPGVPDILRRGADPLAPRKSPTPGRGGVVAGAARLPLPHSKRRPAHAALPPLLPGETVVWQRSSSQWPAQERRRAPALAIGERRSSSWRPACRGVPPCARAHTPREATPRGEASPSQSSTSVHAGERIKIERKREEGRVDGRLSRKKCGSC